MTDYSEPHLLLLRRCAVFSGVFFALLACGLWLWLGDWHEGTIGGPSLRVTRPAPEKTATVLSPYGPGLNRELVSSFSAEYGLSVRWVTVATRDQAFEMLRRGEVDLAVGFADDRPAEDGDASHLPAGIIGGKPYARFHPVRVNGPDFVPLPEGGEGDDDMSLKYPIFSPAMDVDDEKSLLLLDPASFSLWLPLLGATRSEVARDLILPLRWFWSDKDPALGGKLAGFWDDPDREEQLGELEERYYGFLPRRLLPGDILDLWDAVHNRLPRYSDMIMLAAGETGVPPMLLAAVIYRESRFDPNAVSETRVRGIMQLTTATANMLGVDRNDPAQCIMGGARYLRSIWDSLEGRDLSEWDRWFMTLAAYNQGPGSLNGAMRISRQNGDSGETWAELKTAYPRLQNSRGREAVTFVDSVRYYYFILYGLVGLAPAEVEHLTPFLSVGAS